MRTLYAGLMSASLALSSCGSGDDGRTKNLIPQDGKYFVQLRGKPVEYGVKYLGSRCWLRLSSGSVYDYDCNNTADSVLASISDYDTHDRNTLVNTGRAEYFDELLREAQKLAIPENKVPDKAQEDLDKILAPYRK